MSKEIIAVIIPAYNEERLIQSTISSVPPEVEHIVVVDDCSKDRTREILEKLEKANSRLIVIFHDKNQGVGGSIASGYKWARDNQVDVAVVMAGDGQMDPRDFPNVVDPVLSGKADYSKGNRLFTGEAYQKIPKVRYFGNSVLSLLTKISSGYWHVADSQTGYTAIGKEALHVIDWDRMYKRYGQPNDLLVRLNVYNFRVCDVAVTPVYNIGEKSGIKIRKVIFTIPWLLFRLFLWRLKEKYIIRDFHPLVFFYFLGYFFSLVTLILSIRLGLVWYKTGHIPAINALAAMFSFMSASLFSLFAMWFDMESNKDLRA
ncbi:MAG: glycosyltransferase family 2 protein [Vicingaceae bacterium]